MGRKRRKRKTEEYSEGQKRRLIKLGICWKHHGLLERNPLAAVPYKRCPVYGCGVRQ